MRIEISFVTEGNRCTTLEQTFDNTMPLDGPELLKLQGSCPSALIVTSGEAPPAVACHPHLRQLILGGGHA